MMSNVSYPFFFKFSNVVSSLFQLGCVLPHPTSQRITGMFFHLLNDSFMPSNTLYSLPSTSIFMIEGSISKLRESYVFIWTFTSFMLFVFFSFSRVFQPILPSKSIRMLFSHSFSPRPKLKISTLKGVFLKVSWQSLAKFGMGSNKYAVPLKSTSFINVRLK